MTTARDLTLDSARSTATRSAVLDAWTLARGEGTTAARTLGVSRARLYREIQRLDLWPSLDALATAHGWQRRGGAERNGVRKSIRSAAKPRH